MILALIALDAGPYLLTQLVWLGEVFYDGLWLACGTASDFLFRVLGPVDIHRGIPISRKV